VSGKVKLTIPEIMNWPKGERKLRMLTAYDYPTARIIDETDIELVLVGDSLGMVVLGYPNTVPVTVNDIIHHGKAVVRGAPNTIVVVDMPFMSYQVSTEQAVSNAGRLIKETGADAVKVEGGSQVAPVVEAIVRAGIPVMGHLGLTPQNAVQLGGFKVQARTVREAEQMLDDALALARAGAFSLVLESIPLEVGRRVTEGVRIPTIGIGAGKHCDGQVLVLHDLLGMFESFTPKFVKRYAEIGNEIRQAVRAFAADVSSGAFPTDGHSYHLPRSEREKLDSVGGKRDE